MTARSRFQWVYWPLAILGVLVVTLPSGLIPLFLLGASLTIAAISASTTFVVALALAIGIAIWLTPINLKLKIFKLKIPEFKPIQLEFSPFEPNLEPKFSVANVLRTTQGGLPKTQLAEGPGYKQASETSSSQPENSGGSASQGITKRTVDPYFLFSKASQPVSQEMFKEMFKRTSPKKAPIPRAVASDTDLFGLPLSEIMALDRLVLEAGNVVDAKQLIRVMSTSPSTNPFKISQRDRELIRAHPSVGIDMTRIEETEKKLVRAMIKNGRFKYPRPMYLLHVYVTNKDDYIDVTQEKDLIKYVVERLTLGHIEKHEARDIINIYLKAYEKDCWMKQGISKEQEAHLCQNQLFRELCRVTQIRVDTSGLLAEKFLWDLIDKLLADEIDDRKINLGQYGNVLEAVKSLIEVLKSFESDPKKYLAMMDANRAIRYQGEILNLSQKNSLFNQQEQVEERDVLNYVMMFKGYFLLALREDMTKDIFDLLDTNRSLSINAKLGKMIALVDSANLKLPSASSTPVRLSF